jgi:hypothetical protein
MFGLRELEHFFKLPDGLIEIKFAYGRDIWGITKDSIKWCSAL